MDTYDKDLYFVAVKVFLRDHNKLLIVHDIYGEWDLPGGRIKKDEFNTPLLQIIKRKMKEELGDRITYGAVRQAGVFFRVERLEHGLNERVRIFAVGYEAAYKVGEIKLGNHMNNCKWVDVNTFKPEKYFTSGWLAGVQEYLANQRR